MSFFKNISLSTKVFTYLKVSLALITPKSNNSLNDFKTATALDTFTIAFFRRGDIARDYNSFFPQARMFNILDYDTFFTQSPNDSVKMDALLTSAERAGAWTILHPEYKVVNPLPYHLYTSLVFPLGNDEVWKSYIDRWIEYHQQDGSFDRVYQQWILGKEYRQEEPFWSVYNDVLGWGKK